MLKLRVKPKKGKTIVINVADKQEAHSLARGIFKGMKCRILDGHEPRSSKMRTHSSIVWGKFNTNEAGVSLADPYQDWLKSISQ